MAAALRQREADSEAEGEGLGVLAAERRGVIDDG
jgi:hypothetical protein